MGEAAKAAVAGLTRERGGLQRQRVQRSPLWVVFGRSPEAIPVIQEALQSNPRGRALRRPQVLVRGSTLRHAAALPCIRPTV